MVVTGYSESLDIFLSYWDSVFITEKLLFYAAGALLTVLQHIIPFCFVGSSWVLANPIVVWSMLFIVILGEIAIILLTLVLPWIVRAVLLLYYLALRALEICLVLITFGCREGFKEGSLLFNIDMVESILQQDI